MREVAVGRLAEVLGAVRVGDPGTAVGPDVVIDSRAATPGCLFVALHGERADGHDFAAAAVDAGAAALLVERALDLPVPQLLVGDTLAALAVLGRAVAAEASAAGMVTIGITGSSGKTSTKDLLAQVLATAGETVAPVGSFNNEIGVPLTATRVTPSTRFLVSEMGARGQGHIAWLCSVVPPSVGVVVNVGHAHLGEFGSVEAIAQAKGELVEAVPAGGWAVLNDDDPLVTAMRARTPARLAAFSTAGEPGWGDLRVWASDIGADALQRPSFVLHAAPSTESGTAPGPVHPDASAPVQLQVSGAHQVGNALAAAAVALSQGLTVAAVAAALSHAEARSHWRMELVERPDGLLVVNDAYNANPDSMAAALRTLASLRRPGGRLLAVLGDMLELGEGAPDAHREIGVLCADLGIDAVIALGHHATDLAAGYGQATMLVPNRQVAAAAASAWLRPTDVVLVKASRGLGLETVAEDLSVTPEGGRP
ncbi:MAG: UDP-N-acetylmuramoyl-tripeptide--D-alanyl-D-alanine ligase [Propionicimonas sp.]|uniref:UDP-N-acetylmuramoyl-tripeptide--D-alanyl-D- alanine ligase n=1 Tax=Propionicimonas sp. TaxID=1955623 RepID=UPI003D0AB6BD